MFLQASNLVIFSSSDFRILIPDVLLLCAVFIAFLIDTFFEKTPQSIRTTLIAGIVGIAILPLMLAPEAYTSYLLETFAAINQVRIFLLACVLMFLMHSSISKNTSESFIHYCVLGAAIGADLLLLSKHWLMLFISLETLSICSYLLVAHTLKKDSVEASVKYLLIGVASSALMLFGLSLWYGMQGNLELTFTVPLPESAMSMIWILVISGLLFKIAVPPFHFWIPDAYHGTTSPVIAYLSTAPKAAGLLLLWKIYYAQGSYPSAEQLRIILSGVSGVAIIWGSLSALRQSNLKRMLAYSSVAHAGLFLAGILTLEVIEITHILFYLWIYLFTILSALFMLDYFESVSGSVNVNNFKGLGSRLPLAGGIFVFIMIALTGLPPTAVFYGKLFIFTGLLGAYNLSGETIYLILFLIGLAGTLLSLFFYLKGPYYMYFKTSDNYTEQVKSNSTLAFAFAIAVPVLVFFLNPDWLMNLLR